ncbi:D-alanyl-D-alanine carboxypeptidase/D-alanyl-D-alanine-endopeptidase [Specibacter sp. RAF43]
MGRTSTAVTTGLLLVALAAVTVPTGMNLVPALLPANPATAPVLPAAQLAPTSLGAVSGIGPLATSAGLPDAAALSAKLGAALAFDGAGDFSAYVADASTGKTLYSRNGETARTPASNLKLLTAIAALKTLGAQTRFSTRVVAGNAPATIVLKAGGDAMLAAGESDPAAVMGHAGLASLAKDTAAALAAAGIKGPVTVGFDDSLFTGPTLNPKWLSGDVDAGEIAPIYPMALYAGRQAPGTTGGPRPQDAADAVATAFAAALEDTGVVVAPTVSRAGAAPAATVLATAQSATVAEQVDYLLLESDNYLAEVLGRMVAVKQGAEPSYSGAAAGIRSVLAGLGLDLNGVVIADSCGLAPGNLVSAKQLAAAVALMLAHPESDPARALDGLPIAALSGTLERRFTGPETVDGAGVVRAKTGTLNQAATLTGYVVNTKGRLLVFSIMGNKLRGGPATALPAIDAAAAVLARS